MSVLIWVPARGGSVRVADKNLRRVGGATLVARAVWGARQLIAARGLEARVVVDTDDPRIRDEALAHGADVPFLRGPELAGAEAGSAEAALRCVDRLRELGFETDTIVVLQPTSPVRELDHVLECWDRFVSSGSSVISVRRADVEALNAMSMSADGRMEKSGSQI